MASKWFDPEQFATAHLHNSQRASSRERILPVALSPSRQARALRGCREPLAAAGPSAGAWPQNRHPAGLFFPSRRRQSQQEQEIAQVFARRRITPSRHAAKAASAVGFVRISYRVAVTAYM